MSEQQNPMPSYWTPSLWWKFRNRVSRRLWWWTSPIAWQLCKLTKWAHEPGKQNRLLRRICGGIYVGCWAHVCGDGYARSLKMADIYWRIFFPSFRRELNRAVNSVAVKENSNG